MPLNSLKNSLALFLFVPLELLIFLLLQVSQFDYIE